MTSVAVLSRQGPKTLVWEDRQRLAREAHVRYHQLDRAPSRVEAAVLLAGVDIVASTNACLPTLDVALLDALPDLRGVVLYATGYDHIDVDLLATREVGLSVLPDYATNAVAEHAIAMLMSMATRLHLAHDRSRGIAPFDASLRGVELGGRTMGVIGVGRIGTRVAQLGTGLDMRVIGYDHAAHTVDAAQAEGIAMTARDHLLASVDALLLCASHRFGAPPIIGPPELGALRPHAFVVNVARADLVDTRAATTAIRAGLLRGYAVDDVVLDPGDDEDLLAEGRVLQTAHSAWWRDEVLARGQRMWADHLLAAIAGVPRGGVTWPARRHPATCIGAGGHDQAAPMDDGFVMTS